MRRLKKRDEIEKTPSLEKGEEPDISPQTAAERAEERIFEESLRKGRIASGYRTKIGDKK
jgi:hypothetical protein